MQHSIKFAFCGFDLSGWFEWLQPNRQNKAAFVSTGDQPQMVNNHRWTFVPDGCFKHFKQKNVPSRQLWGHMIGSHVLDASATASAIRCGFIDAQLALAEKADEKTMFKLFPVLQKLGGGAEAHFSGFILLYTPSSWKRSSRTHHCCSVS